MSCSSFGLREEWIFFSFLSHRAIFSQEGVGEKWITMQKKKGMHINAMHINAHKCTHRKKRGNWLKSCLLTVTQSKQLNKKKCNNLKKNPCCGSSSFGRPWGRQKQQQQQQKKIELKIWWKLHDPFFQAHFPRKKRRGKNSSLKTHTRIEENIFFFCPENFNELSCWLLWLRERGKQKK